jgi:hypothetical protein
MPSPRYGAKAVYDPQGNQFIVMGGNSVAFWGYGLLRADGAMWALGLNGTPTWRSFGYWSAVFGQSAVYDLAGGSIILYGGEYSALEQDTYDRASRLMNPLGPTAVLVSLVEASATPVSVHLTWSTADATTALLWRRGPGPGTGWSALATLTPDVNGVIAYEDRDVVAGRAYDYRLEARDAKGGSVSSETHIEIPLRAAFMLDGAAPNPVSGALRISFSLPADGAATLDVIDVSGRRVVHRSIDAGAGRHELQVARAGELAPGVYQIRLSREGQSLTRRMSVVR